MQTSVIDETTRLAALESLRVLDTAPEDRFDRIVRLAAWVADAPIALLSLVDDRRQWFKARVGLDAAETPREHAFCAHVVADGRPLWVADATLDARFRDNPLVTGAPGIRFYFGSPVRLSNGAVVGTVCVIDHVARLKDQALVTRIEDLAAAAAAELERRAGETADFVRDLAQAAERCGQIRVAPVPLARSPAPPAPVRPSDYEARIREAEQEAALAGEDADRRVLFAIADLWRGLAREQKLRRALSNAA